MSILVDKKTLRAKELRLLEMLKKLPDAALAFSGGVDSSLLLAALLKAGVKPRIFMAVTPTVPQFELKDAGDVARFLRCDLQKIAIDQLSIPEFCANESRRCYFCKRLLLSAIARQAKNCGCKYLLDGANADDSGDYRPGMLAARELGVISPLLACGFTKNEVRALAAQYNLPVAAKPAYACLASRIAYGEEITYAKLRMVEQAEDALSRMGLRDLRVRCHGGLARIEAAPAQLPLAAGALREQIITAVKNAGFTYVTIDLEGFCSGSMNRVLKRE